MNATIRISLMMLLLGAAQAVGQDRKPELVLQRGHTREVTSAAFSPDGKRVVTSSGDSAVIIWDAMTGIKLRAITGGAGSVESASYSADGKSIVAAMWDKTANVWDAETGEKLASLIGHTGPVRHASFSFDLKSVVTASGDKSAIIWDASTGRKIHVLNGHTRDVTSASFSPDGKRIVTASQDGTAVVWDARTGETLKTLEGHGIGVESAHFSPNGSRIITAGWDKSAMVWDVATGKKQLTLDGHTGIVHSACFSPDGKRVATASNDKTAMIWDATTGQKLLAFSGHEGTVHTARFSPDGKRIVTSSWDMTSIIWDADSGAKLLLLQGGQPFNNVSIGANGKRIANTTWIKNASDGRLPTIPGRPDLLDSASKSPDGKRVITWLTDRTAIVWDTGTGEKAMVLKGHWDGVSSANFSPDGKRIVTSSWDKTAIVWDASSGEKINTLRGTMAEVRFARFSPDGDRIITASIRHDHTAIIWNATTGEKLLTVKGHTDDIESAVFSPDGNRILTASGDGTAVIWNAATGGKITALRGHASGVISACYSPDAKRIVTGSSDRTAIVWDSATGAKLFTLEGHKVAVYSADFSSDAKWIFTASGDGTNRFWDADTGKERAAILSLDGGKDWLVVTPEGLFDGSAGGRRKVAFRVDGKLDVVPVDHFFRDFYYPGLLAEIMAGRRPLPGKSITANNPAPSVKMLVHPAAGGAAPNQVAVDVAVTDAGGGMSGPYLQHNRASVRAGKLLQQDGKTKTYRFTLDLVTGENNFEARAATADRVRESDPVGAAVSFNGKLPEPDLYVLAVGINKHIAGAGFTDLNFAVPDAKAVAELFRQRAGAMYKNVHVTLLLDEQATREGILKAVEEIAKKARSQDTLVMFQSGHGMAVGQRFYLIPHDYKKTNASAVAAPIPSTANVVATRGYKSVEGAETAIPSQGLAADDLGDALSAVPALRRVLIFDTCYSGGAAKLAETGHNPFAARGAVARGAVERFARSQGVYLLTAVAANDEANEIEDLGHGILTYSLLAGSGRAAGGPLLAKGLPADRTVDVLAWFGYARSNVPSLCQTYVGREQHVEIAGSDQPSFPLLTSSK